MALSTHPFGYGESNSDDRFGRPQTSPTAQVSPCRLFDDGFCSPSRTTAITNDGRQINRQEETRLTATRSANPTNTVEERQDTSAN